MAELIANADLAIGAGGTVTWERLCLGLPALVVSVADNQKVIAEDCARSGLQVYLGPASDVSQAVLTAALQTVLLNPSLLMHISAQAMKAVDGKGLARVVQQHAEREARPFRPLYDWSDPVVDKITAVATKMYGADAVAFTKSAERDLAEIERLGYGDLPVCIAKVPGSLSDNPKLRGRPEDLEITVRGIQIN